MLIERGDSSKRMIPLFILLVCSGFGNVQCDTDVYGKLFGQGVCSIHREDTKRVLTYQRNVHPEMEYTLCWNFPPRCETPTGKELEEFITVPQDIKHEILSLKCCANYYPSKDDSFCIPICSQLCLPSKCLSPNNCSECQAGHYGPACTNAKDTLSNLPPVPYECECPNENYMCTNDLKCVCVAGFGGPSCQHIISSHRILDNPSEHGWIYMGKVGAIVLSIAASAILIGFLMKKRVFWRNTIWNTVTYEPLNGRNVRIV